MAGMFAVVLYKKGYFPSKKIETIPVPLTIDVEVSDDWRYYKNELGYSIKMPPNILVDTDFGESSIRLLPETESGRFGPRNFIYISLVSRKNLKSDNRVFNYNYEQFLDLMKINIGESKSITAQQSQLQGYNDWFIYERLEDTIIDGRTARVFINKKPWEFPLGVAEIRYVIPEDQTIYILGAYFGGDISYAKLTRSEVKKIFSTFKITPISSEPS